MKKYFLKTCYVICAMACFYAWATLETYGGYSVGIGLLSAAYLITFNLANYKGV